MVSRIVLAVFFATTALCLTACSSGGDEFDPNEIAVKQEGERPTMPRPGAPTQGQ
jgi:hypothetical protein